MKKVIKIFIAIASLLTSPLSVSAEDSQGLELLPLDVSSQFFDFSIDDIKVVAGDGGPVLILLGEFKNTQDNPNEPEFDFDFSNRVSQGANANTAEELELVEDFDFDNIQLIENTKKDLDANESIDVAFAYALIDDSTVFIQDKGFLFSSDGSKFSHEVNPYNFDIDGLIVAKAIDERVQEVAEDVFGSKLESTSVSKDGYITIEAQVGDNFSNSWIRDGFESLVKDTLERIQPFSYQSISFTGYFDMVDQYGNVENVSVFIVDLSKNEVDKIQFENFRIENLKNLANNYGWHPSFID